MMLLRDFKAFAEQFCHEHLTDYTNGLVRQRRVAGRKEINDPLWGTIGLEGPEVALIDSPLLQRLRLIRQLGVVHWVYPGAIHTRFEHTLGVLRQVQSLCGAINNLGTQQGYGELIDRSRVNLLRLAALLHDLGHAAFSHVSEHALDTLEGFSSLASEFALERKGEERSLSEIFAYFCVQSTPMRRLLEVLIDNNTNYIKLSEKRPDNVSMIVGKLADAIVGRPIDDRIPLLHEIISGPFDADKLDYFVRDSRAAGTPSLLDISRLIQKIAVRPFGPAELPGMTGRNIKALDQHFLIGIKWSGISVLDELHLSRVLLYSKIYRHPKVIAIEQMVASALILLAKATDGNRVMRLVYRHNDDELISMSANSLANALGVEIQNADAPISERLQKAASILSDLKLRKLSVKAFQLQRTYPGDPIGHEKSQKEGLIEFRERLETPGDLEVFRSALITEVERLLLVLGRFNRSRIDLEGSITIRAIGRTSGGAQIGRAWLVPRAGAALEFREYLVNRTAWADSYLSDHPAGYVFCDEEIADIVFIAVERLLRTDHGIRLPPSALEASKRDDDDVQSLKRTLATNGYFVDAPFDIRPLPKSLDTAAVLRSIASFRPKLEAYQPPVDPGVSQLVQPEAAIRNWLRQFDNDGDVECACALLDAIRLIERRDTVHALEGFIKAHPHFNGAIVVPFGSARDSSAIHSYFAADLLGQQVQGCMSLEDALHQSSGQPIIFVDDFVGSGGQSKDVLAAGFGRDDLRADLGENRDLFSSDIQSFLRSTKLGFVFTAAWTCGLDEVRRTTTELRLDATVFRHLDEEHIPFAKDALNKFHTRQVDGFLQRSGEIGLSLLSSRAKRRHGEDEDSRRSRLASRKLGYGNRAMLLISPFNVPTQTFTPLWAAGAVNGVNWTPLLPRRNKA